MALTALSFITPKLLMMWVLIFGRTIDNSQVLHELCKPYGKPGLLLKILKGYLKQILFPYIFAFLTITKPQKPD
jgi:hypothetical protein